jgi:hypothetical protein
MDHDGMMGRQLLGTLAILVCGLIPDRLAGGAPARLRASLSRGMFNQTDASRIERGYYQQLIDAGRRLDDLGDLPALRGQRRAGNTFSAPVDSAPLVMRVDDLREVVLKPSESVVKGGIEWRTNAQGMRDRSYSIEKAEGTFRIALVGDSIGAGWGVRVEQRFETILERDWGERSRRACGPTVEIINCAVPGHSPGQRWYHFGQVGWPMSPDLVICEATEADAGWDERRLRYVLARGQGFDSAIYRDALTSAKVSLHWDPEQYKRALQPRHREILTGVYRSMAADCRARGVPIVWVLIPRVGRLSDPAVHQTLLESARGALFNRVVDLSDAYDGLDPGRLAVEPNDFHPNAEGHSRLARRLDAALSVLPELGPILGQYPTVSTGGQAGEDLHRSPRGAKPQ